jgi:hypothetical protein
MNRSDKKSSEFEDLEEDDQLADVDRQDFWESDKEAPKRTPIRRKNRTRVDDFEPKNKREDKRKNKPLKYDW